MTVLAAALPRVRRWPRPPVRLVVLALIFVVTMLALTSYLALLMDGYLPIAIPMLLCATCFVFVGVEVRHEMRLWRAGRQGGRVAALDVFILVVSMQGCVLGWLVLAGVAPR